MGNCLVIQSEDSVFVGNALLAGIIQANHLNPIYERVYGGLHGIDGLLNQEFVDLTDLSESQIEKLKQTSSSLLGLCHDQLKKENQVDLVKINSILNAYNIDVLFYIGGKQAMEMVATLAQFAADNRIYNHRFIGLPNTMNNDLLEMDHTPGYSSASALLINAINTSWLNLNAYCNDSVFILETPELDSGWLAASSVLSNKVDVLIIPEVGFVKEKFVKKVREVLKEKRHCYIVASAGAKYLNGTYLANFETDNGFSRQSQSKSLATILKEILIEEGVATKIETLAFSNLSSCYNLLLSKLDLEEAYHLAISGHTRSSDATFTGMIVSLEREDNKNYCAKYSIVNALSIVNKTKQLPKDWILQDYLGMSPSFVQYLTPLIEKEAELTYQNGQLVQLEPFYNKKIK